VNVFVVAMSARFEVRVVEVGHDAGLREVQEVRIALDIVRVVLEPLAAERLLREPAPLQQHPPGAVEDHDAFIQEGGEVVGAAHAPHPSGTEEAMTNGHSSSRSRVLPLTA
jgi:hypothetical protein